MLFPRLAPRPFGAAAATHEDRLDSALDGSEALAQLALADAADTRLLLLVLGAASATLALALAASLV